MTTQTQALLCQYTYCKICSGKFHILCAPFNMVTWTQGNYIFHIVNFLCPQEHWKDWKEQYIRVYIYSILQKCVPLETNRTIIIKIIYILVLIDVNFATKLKISSHLPIWVYLSSTAIDITEHSLQWFNFWQVTMLQLTQFPAWFIVTHQNLWCSNNY